MVRTNPTELSLLRRSLAFSCRKAKPKQSQWYELDEELRDVNDHPLEPGVERWQCEELREQNGQSWYALDSESSEPLEESEAMKLRDLKDCTISIVWLQRIREYRVFQGDCSDYVAEDADNPDTWDQLAFREIPREPTDAPLFELYHTPHGDRHPSGFGRELGHDFYRLLPASYFAQDDDQGCRLVMKLPLLIGLLAMCPRDSRKVPAQIGQHFRTSGFPQLYLLDSDNLDGRQGKHERLFSFVASGPDIPSYSRKRFHSGYQGTTQQRWGSFSERWHDT